MFRKVNRWGDVEPAALHPDAVRQILRRRAVQTGLTVSGLERLSPHGLRAGFITEAYRQGARDEEIMDHTRHRDLRTMRGYVRRAKLLSESPVKKLGQGSRLAMPRKAVYWRCRTRTGSTTTLGSPESLATSQASAPRRPAPR
ncbi:site-specific integrase [Paracraurococcus lichenis]|uniref:Tyr recombinase domain-containing protein n=1 Tax=Paracraurococcus lichenis TaxID=3064888 RepID=A0ABT9EDV8_9PROT|nr:hypothetical protein [Paracraurococcus sp. LOR1-02]MDO9714200.1 hypothetical protein [Paracraurococcus sp. LOR1-02]